MVTVLGMVTTKRGYSSGDDSPRYSNYQRDGDHLGMVTVFGMVTVPGVMNILMMVGAANYTPF